MGQFDGLFDVGKLLAGFLPGVGGIASGVIGGAQSIYDQMDAKSVADQANQNLEARQDNAVQRRVADLRAAGLAPQLAAGSAASSGGEVAAHSSDQDLAGQAFNDVADRKAKDAAQAQAQANAAAALMRQSDDHLLSQAHRDLIQKQMSNMDRAQQDKEDQNAAVNAQKAEELKIRQQVADAQGAAAGSRGRMASAAEQRAATAASLSEEQIRTMAAQRALDSVTAQLRAKGISEVEARTRAENAIATQQQERAQQATVSGAPRDFLLNTLHLSPVVVAAIEGMYAGAKNLVHQGAQMIGGGE